eukprot:scaffold16521_cov56-Phaeocystis_antarctica.AAC.1
MAGGLRQVNYGRRITAGGLRQVNYGRRVTKTLRSDTFDAEDSIAERRRALAPVFVCLGLSTPALHVPSHFPSFHPHTALQQAAG